MHRDVTRRPCKRRRSCGALLIEYLQVQSPPFSTLSQTTNMSYDPNELPGGWVMQFDSNHNHPFWVSSGVHSAALWLIVSIRLIPRPVLHAPSGRIPTKTSSSCKSILISAVDLRRVGAPIPHLLTHRLQVAVIPSQGLPQQVLQGLARCGPVHQHLTLLRRGVNLEASKRRTSTVASSAS